MLEMRCRPFGESFSRGVQTFREVSEFRCVATSMEIGDILI